jgi:hypothetical protein
MIKSPASTRQLLNAMDRPRVLYLMSLDGSALLTEDQVRQLTATFRRITSLHEVDLREWDALVTDMPISTSINFTFSREVPPHLNVFYLFAPWADPFDGGDENSPFDTGQNGAWYATVRNAIPGHHIEVPANLPLDLDELVRRDLRSAVEARAQQYSFEVIQGAGSGVKVTPFAFGPNTSMLCGRYQLGDDGSSVWAIPRDVPDALPWFMLSMKEWAQTNPRSFPQTPDWRNSDIWATDVERQTIREIADAKTERIRLAAQLGQRIATLESELTTSRDESDLYEKVLLTGQGDDLQRSATRALSEMGFTVKDMDEKWPDGMRREDLHIADDDVPGWLALGEVTGTRRGLGQDKVTRALNHLTAYIIRERPSVAPPMWLIANQFIEKDPNARHELLNADAIDGIREGGNLLLDSVALYRLLMFVRRDTRVAVQIRKALRDATGRFAVPEAEALIESASLATKGEK